MEKKCGITGSNPWAENPKHRNGRIIKKRILIKWKENAKQTEAWINEQ
jgi:hypothetical protein